MSVCGLLHNHPCGLLLQGDPHIDPKRDLLDLRISSINSLYKESKKQPSPVCYIFVVPDNSIYHNSLNSCHGLFASKLLSSANMYLNLIQLCRPPYLVTCR